jgi:AcrR family transcriptional regulator
VPIAPQLSPLAPKQDRSVATRGRLLDAVIEELLVSGYSGVTASAVSRRAGVTRGAQQHHFPHKDMLVAEAVQRLSTRQIKVIQQELAAAPRGRARVQHALDTIYRSYAGPLFAASVELSLAAKHEPALEPVIREHERRVSEVITGVASEVFPAEVLSKADFVQRWATAVGAARGIAMLRMFDHPSEIVDGQWMYARRALLAMLLD